MSKRNRNDRRALVALAIVVGAAVLASGFGFLEQAQRAAYRQPAEQGTASEYDEDWWEDTLPQWLMAVFAVAATGVGIWTIVLLNDTLKATRRANKDARLSAEQQLRAYIQIELGSVECTPIRMKVSIKMHNKGQTPAHNVTPMNIVRLTSVPLSEDSALRALAESTALTRDINELESMTLGPDTVFRHTFTSGDEISTAEKDGLAKLNDGTLMLIYAGKVLYTDVFNNVRATRFLHTHRRKDGEWESAYHHYGNDAD